MRSRTGLVAAALVLAACAGDDTSTPSLGPTFPPLTASPPTSPATTTTMTPTLPTAAPITSTLPTTAPTAREPSTTAVPPTTRLELPPDEIAISVEPVASIELPIALATRPGDPTLFVASQPGFVWAVRDGEVAPEPVLDVSAATEAEGERGLLGLAFAPDGDRAVVYSTDRRGDVQVEVFAVDGDGRFDRDSRRSLLTVRHREFPNHNGGSVAFGPDGMVYLGIGDGGGGGDPLRAGQDPTTLLGKLVRLDARDSVDAVPPDNPFVGVDGVRPEIWSWGLRNPWRFSFDRLTGDLWIGDVGQNRLEEIDMVPAALGGGRGANFGWSAYEGSRRYNDDQQADQHVPPVWEYLHTGDNASVTGGYVYRGTAVPGLYGAYVFGDYASGRIWALRLNDEDAPDVAQIASVPSIASFGEDDDGELYVLSLTEGTVFRIVAG